MAEIQELLIAIAPSILVGVIMFYFNRKQNKHFEKVEKRDADRIEENLLVLELLMANGKLSYAIVAAIKRGEVNGEVETGITAYEEARKKYFSFLNRQAIENIHKR